MASYTIAAVRVVPYAVPVMHEHIEAVRLIDGITVFTRAQVIAKLRAYDTFTTVGNPPGRVYEHRCPFCGTGDYITTHPDSTVTNNLLHLLRF